MHDVGTGILGAHAFPPGRPYFVVDNGWTFAVDGEAGLYASAETAARNPGQALWKLDPPHYLSLRTRWAGNVAVVDAEAERWWVVADSSGSFPLYYTEAAGGLVFSSLLRPLVEALKAASAEPEVDLIAVLERMKRDYMLDGRTYFRRVKRLLPGQQLSYHPAEDGLVLSEGSDLWTKSRQTPCAGADLAEACWSELRRSVEDTLSLGPGGLMMSAGWDSRTILAVTHRLAGSANLVCYSHGDLDSRELALTQRLCSMCELDLVTQALTQEMHEPAFLDTVFDRIETCLFPDWTYAGGLLAGKNCRTVSAGVFGEVMGGHYGITMVRRGLRKALAFAAEFSGLSATEAQDHPVDLSGMVELLALRVTDKPWFLSRAAWEELPRLNDQVAADTESTLARLVSRGVDSNSMLLEAYITENLGAQYIAEQTVSMRAKIDVALPFAGPRLLQLASGVPSSTKIHNRLNQAMLLKHAPRLAKVPTGATLVPATYPILLQESSRFARRSYENLSWRLHFATKGLVGFPRLNWWQLEFLRNGVAFNHILEDLRADIWDRRSIYEAIRDVADQRIRFDWRSPTALLTQHMLRIATVDRMLR